MQLPVGEEMKLAEERYIGQSQLRQEGPAKLKGRGGYVQDYDFRNMTYARLILSPYAHARVRAIRTEAARLPGVVAVYTAETLPRTGLLAERETFYVGEPVAVVVAEDPSVAEDAAELVEVDFEELPAVVDPIEAMREDAPPVRTGEVEASADAGAHGETAGGAGAVEVHSPNISNTTRYERGNVEAGFAEADAVVERTFRLPWVYQGFMETHGSTAQTDVDGGIHVWTATQGQFMVRRSVAQHLGVGLQDVTVSGTTVGGGFGGKTVLLESLVAALTRKVGRPVSVILDRLHDFLVNNSGPGAVITIKVGGKKDGSLTAMQVESIFDCGAEGGAPAGLAAFMMGATYRCPNLDLAGFEVLTNKTPNGAYRAPGAPQAYFALESALDELIRKLGWDPVEFRLKNVSREGDPQPSGRPWPRTGLYECLQRLSEHPRWKNRSKAPGHGFGVAVGGWNGGLEPAAAACQIHGDGSVVVQVGSVDITGTNSAFRAIAADVLSIPIEQVRVQYSDTAQAPYAGMAGGSKTTYTVGAAVQAAAQEVRRQILEMAAERLEAAAEDLEIQNGVVSVKGVPGRGVTVAELASGTVRFGGTHAPLFAQGRSAISKQAPGFAAHLVEVEVDAETGLVRIVGYVAIQDVGKALNPREVMGQIHGGVAQGIGRAMLEALNHDATGQLTRTSFMDYLLPTSHDVPNIEVELVEVPAPDGPFGAKGVGEPPAIPGAAAITNAVYDATGVRVTDLPISPDAVLEGMLARV
jgi:CO/xanthine dehydrogenase Mo-binding subunit